jgi:hypothetical protein
MAWWRDADDADPIIVEYYGAILWRDLHHILSQERRGKKHGEAR